MKNNGKYFTVVCGCGKPVPGSYQTSNPNLFAVFPQNVYPFEHCGYTFFAHHGVNKDTGKYYQNLWMVSEQQTGLPVMARDYGRRKDAIDVTKRIITRYADTMAETIAKNKIQVVDRK